MRRRQRIDAVSEQTKGVGSESVDVAGASEVQPSGQPINHSTNEGFSRRREVGAAGEEVGPSVVVPRAGGRERAIAWVASPSPAFGEMPDRLWLPLTVGVAQEHA